jgi:hypothetical protein
MPPEETELNLEGQPAAETPPVDTGAQPPPADTGKPAGEQEIDVHKDEGGELISDFGDAIDKAAKKAGAFGDKTETEKPAGEAGAKDGEKPAETDEEKAAREAEEKKKADEAAAAPKPEDAKAKRDADLAAAAAKLDPHSSTKTKQLFNEQSKRISEARDRVDALEVEKKAIQAELDERKKAPLPKEVETELTQLRDLVRELDVTRDPQLVEKYDSRISENTETVIAALKEAGLSDAAAAKLQKAGLTLGNLKSYLEMIETGKAPGGEEFAADPDTAEKIREAVRENARLTKDKELEVSKLKTGYEDRKKAEKATQDQIVADANKRWETDFKGHIARWDFLKQPPAPDANDAPAVRKQKEAAITKFNESVNQFAAAIKKETSTPTEAVLSARIGILYRDQVVPRLAEQRDAAQARIKTLEAEIARLKGAGTLTKTVSSTPRQIPKAEPVAGESFDDIIDANARAAGVLK